jgi:hypothetical protein
LVESLYLNPSTAKQKERKKERKRKKKEKVVSRTTIRMKLEPNRGKNS